MNQNGGVTASGNSAVESRTSNAEQFENPFEQWGVSLEMNQAVGDGEFVWIAAYRDFIAHSLQHSDFVDVAAWKVGTSYDEIKTYTHEVRYQAESARFDWMIGAYFSEEEIEERTNLELGADFGNYIGATLGVLSGGALSFPAMFNLPQRRQL